LIESLRIVLPEAIKTHLAKESSRAPDPLDDRFARNSVTVVASAGISLDAAAAVGRDAGYSVSTLSDAIEGEARDIGLMHAALAKQVADKNAPFKKPSILLSGGETTVTLRGKGRGGRNTEFLLSFAQAIEGTHGISALAADTDGIDGSEDNAGAFADGQSVLRMRAGGVDPRAALSGNDAWSAFDAAGDLFVPGPTGTNVNDLRAIVIEDV
jgi:glycerate 2-kinase